MKKKTYEIEIICRTPNLIGELPIWNQAEEALYWTDVKARKVFRLAKNGLIVDWTLPYDVGAIAFRRAGGLIVATGQGFCALDLSDGKVTKLIDPEAHIPGHRLNDGKCDRKGRFWCGSRAPDNDHATGSLYRLDPDLTVHRMDHGFICSNGIAFSPDDRRMTFADSFGSGVAVYDFDLENGLISGRRPFHQTAGFPWIVDGATFNSEGYYWCALPLGSAIGRFDGEGRLVGLIEVPMRHPTMCNFGGPDMGILYVTSASFFMTEEEKPCQPYAGMLLAIRGLGVQGLPEPAFAG